MSLRPMRRAHFAAATAALCLLTPQVSLAGAVPMLDIAPRGTAASPPVVDTVLKHLPAGHDELMFRGESATRSFTVQLGRSEAARTTTFQLALLNAVSLLPERSSVKLTVNGTVLAAVPAGSPDKPTVLPIRIPPGVLVPGANIVRITTSLGHRVDCSVKATYELWALVEPTLTGFKVPREALAPIRSLDDLALEPLAEDGTTRIHLRLGDDPDPADVTQATALVDAVARRAGLVRPVVDVGPDRGTGAGFDVDVSGAEGGPATPGLTILGHSAGVAVGRDSVTNRLVVVLAQGTDAGTLATRPAGASPGVRPPLRQGFRRTLTELGLPTETFAGRHYTSTLDVTLPPDFLASNDRARLLLDGSHAGTLVEGDGLVFRVNDTLVSSLPFAAGKPERFQHTIVELPLRFFHPGHNEIAIEGTTSAVADAQCDTVAMSREPRMVIAGSSELDFPSFAHLATLPQIPAALAFDAGAVDGAAHLYLPGNDRISLGTGLTVLANMAVTQDRMNQPQIHLGMPADSDPPGVVIEAIADLPESVGREIGRMVAQPASPPEGVAPGDAAPVNETAAGAPDDATDAAVAVPPRAGWFDGITAAYTQAVDTQGASVMEAAQAMLRDRGFFFAGDQKDASMPLAAGGLLIAAVAPQASTTTVAGITVPYLTRDASHWLVVTAASRETAQAALGRLVADGRWAALGGEAVSFDPAADTLHVLRPRTVSYVLPDRLVAGDLRPILGGLMSDNIVLSVVAMLALMAVLGLSTHVLVRRMGVR